MNYLGLDLSLASTGYAVADLIVRAHGTLRPPKEMRGVTRLHWIEQRVRRLVKRHSPSLVTIEGYAMGARGRVFDIGELGGVIRLALHRMDTDFLVVPPSTLKQFATGKGNANKDKVILSMSRFALVEDDNAADAVALALFGRQYRDPQFSESVYDFSVLKEKCRLTSCP
jgi:crossover junction endodeoxyribonuclease RuvC